MARDFVSEVPCSLLNFCGENFLSWVHGGIMCHSCFSFLYKSRDEDEDNLGTAGKR